MKVRLSAGAELDMLTRDEVAGVLRSWSNELTRGARLRRHSLIGAANAAGELLIGENADGPAEGMVWAITRVSVLAGAALPADGIRLYANDTVSPAGLLLSRIAPGAVSADVFPGSNGIILGSGDSLRLAGSGVAANLAVSATLQIKEVPALMAWSLQ